MEKSPYYGIEIEKINQIVTGQYYFFKIPDLLKVSLRNDQT